MQHPDSPLIPKVGDTFVNNAFSSIEYKVVEVPDWTNVRLSYGGTEFDAKISDLLRVASLKIVAPKVAAKQECRHLKTVEETYFSARKFRYCVDCGEKV